MSTENVKLDEDIESSTEVNNDEYGMEPRTPRKKGTLVKGDTPNKR